jgi:hypothetical protein
MLRRQLANRPRTVEIQLPRQMKGLTSRAGWYLSIQLVSQVLPRSLENACSDCVISSPALRSHRTGKGILAIAIMEAGVFRKNATALKLKPTLPEIIKRI